MKTDLTSLGRVELIDSDLCLFDPQDRGPYMVWNIYEFMYKCKEWAASCGIHLHSWPNNCDIRDAQGCFEHTFNKDTEYEAVFAACTWISTKLKGK